MKSSISWLRIFIVLNLCINAQTNGQSTNTQLCGRVVYENGTPISTGHVLATSFSGIVTGVSSTSNGFNISVPSGSWNVSIDNLTSALPGYMQPTLPFFECTGQPTNSIGDIVVRPCSSVISGRLCESNGIPIAGVPVLGELSSGNLNYYSKGCTDSNGYYRLAVCNGSWTVQCSTLTRLGYASVAPMTTLVSNSTNRLDFSTQKSPVLRIDTSSLTSAYQDLSYASQLLASGGAPPYYWRAISNSLPSWLQLSSDGWLAGSPTQASNYSIGVVVTDNLGTSKTNTFSLGVGSATVLKMATINNRVSLYLIGDSNKRYTIEHSDNIMTNWVPIVTNWTAGAMVTPTNWGAGPQQFYRVRSE